jgi:hypothetical protein
MLRPALLLFFAHTALADETLEQKVDRMARELAEVNRELAELKAQRPLPSPEPARTAAPIASLAEGSTRPATKASLTLGGYAEVFWQWNFNKPSNGITNFRGFDNRHNTFMVSNAVLDALGTLGSATAHVALQIGETSETYYLQEPTSRGANGAGASSINVWKYIQQANLAWTAPLGRGLTIDAGIFLSPIGPEGMAIKDQWNWSRSDLFFGLPFYHTGFRVTYPFTDRLTLSLQCYNGWNSVLDNNAEKSLALQVTYTIADKLTYQFIYFTGVERPTGAPEGDDSWRHMFDTYLALYPKTWLSLLAHFNAGFEPNRFGTSGWTAAALYARFHPLKWMYLVARGDFFYEWIPGRATPIFWAGSSWVSSGTATIDLRPIDNISFRVEYRHDQSQRPLYFRDQVDIDANGNFVANASSQDTLTFGAVAWF